jgi:glutamate carboxypeptidase
MKIINSLLALCFSCFITAVHANTEQEIISQVNKGLAQSLIELEEVVNINSGTMNFAGVKQVGDVFKKQFEQLGFESEWLDGGEFNRAGHLVAKYGNSGPRILMIGHLDTVFAKNDAFQKFQRIDDIHIAGPGITDMKGGDVIIVAALRALKAAGVLDKVSIQVVMTGDEESSGRPLIKSKKALIDAAKWADIALGFEDGDGDIGTAVVARRGSVGWTLDVTGKPAHSSQIFREDVGFGAVFEIARILNTYREELSTIKNLTFNPGLLLGGTRIDEQGSNGQSYAFGKSNVIAKTAKASGGIRAISPQQLSDAKKVMQKITADSLAHTSAQLTFDEGYPPMAPTKANYKLLALYNKVSQKLGYGEVVAVDPRRAGAADISFAATHVKMSLDGLGLMGRGGHTKDEVADISSLEKNTKKAAMLIYRLSEHHYIN